MESKGETMRLYFANRFDERRLIGEPKTKQQAMKMIADFCKAHDYSFMYVRTWEDDDGATVYDVGNHSEFFYLYSDEMGEANVL